MLDTFTTAVVDLPSSSRRILSLQLLGQKYHVVGEKPSADFFFVSFSRTWTLERTPRRVGGVGAGRFSSPTSACQFWKSGEKKKPTFPSRLLELGQRLEQQGRSRTAVPGGSDSELGGEHDLAAGVDVFHDALLEAADLLAQFHHDGGQFAVLALELLHLVLEPGDALELAPPALGGGDAVALALALQLDALLVLHVDR